MELTTTIPSFQTRRPPAHLFVGATALLVSHILLFARVEPVYTYFFSFAWWPCILLLDGLVYWRTGDSLLVNRPGEFVLVAFVSIPAWCLYEVFNFRLQNWYYVMLPQAPWGYRLNYAVGFSMAFPAIFETMAFLQSFPFLHRVRTPPFLVTRRVLSVVFCVGVAATILPLSWPALFFPLVWVTTTLLLEPILYLRGGRSLLADLERGNPQRLLTLLAAGVVCGGLWEFWNFLTRAKWIYTVPFFEDLKLFEMPLLGYLGFPAFAIECYVMYAFVGLFRTNRGWESEPTPLPGRVSPLLAVTGISCALVFNYLIFEGINRWTVYSHHLTLAAIPGVTSTESHAFLKNGLHYPYEVVESVDHESLETVATRVELPVERLREVYEQCRLIEMKGLGTSVLRLLHAAGITQIATLAEQDIPLLTTRLAQLATDLGQQPPYARQVRVWVREAQRLTQRAARSRDISPARVSE